MSDIHEKRSRFLETLEGLTAGEMIHLLGSETTSELFELLDLARKQNRSAVYHIILHVWEQRP